MCAPGDQENSCNSQRKRASEWMGPLSTADVHREFSGQVSAGTQIGSLILRVLSAAALIPLSKKNSCNVVGSVPPLPTLRFPTQFRDLLRFSALVVGPSGNLRE